MHTYSVLVRLHARTHARTHTHTHTRTRTHARTRAQEMNYLNNIKYLHYEYYSFKYMNNTGNLSEMTGRQTPDK